MKMPLNDTSIRDALRESVSRVLESERALSTEAATELDRLIAELMPLVEEQTRALVNSNTPKIASAYLDVLEGTVYATVARLGLRAIATQKRLLARAITGAVQVLAAALRVAIVAA